MTPNWFLGKVFMGNSACLHSSETVTVLFAMLTFESCFHILLGEKVNNILLLTDLHQDSDYFSEGYHVEKRVRKMRKGFI